MTFYAPVPLALLYSLRVRPLTWAERGVLHHLYTLAGASPDGVTVEMEKRTGEADVSAWSRALGAEGAAILGKLVEESFFEIVPQGLRVTILTRATAAAQTPQESTRARPTTQPPSRAVKPSETPAGRRERNDRADFEKRVGATFASVPVGVAWTDWLQSPAAYEHLAAREITHPGYGAIVAGVVGRASPSAEVAPPSAPGSAPVAPPGSAPLSSPHTPLLSPKKEREERERVAPPEVAPSAPLVAPPGSAGATPAGNDLLDALRAAAGDRATLPLTGSAIERGAAKVLTASRVTLDEIRRMGEALGEPARWWPSGKDAPPKHCTWKPLAGYRADGGGYEYGPLLALLAHVRSAQTAAATQAPKPAVIRGFVQADPALAKEFRL